MKLSIRKCGFTVVELIVVITLIAVLATVSYFILSGWRVETAKTEVMNQLKVVEDEINNYRNFNNNYPTSLTQLDYETSSAVDITYYYRSINNTYCLNGVSSIEPAVQYMIDTRDSKYLDPGMCTS